MLRSTQQLAVHAPCYFLSNTPLIYLRLTLRCFHAQLAAAFVQWQRSSWVSGGSEGWWEQRCWGPVAQQALPVLLTIVTCSVNTWDFELLYLEALTAVNKFKRWFPLRVYIRPISLVFMWDRTLKTLHLPQHLDWIHLFTDLKEFKKRLIVSGLLFHLHALPPQIPFVQLTVFVCVWHVSLGLPLSKALKHTCKC